MQVLLSVSYQTNNECIVKHSVKIIPCIICVLLIKICAMYQSHTFMNKAINVY